MSARARSRRSLLVGAVLLIGVVVLVVGWRQLSTPNVLLTLEPTFSGNVLTLAGTTDLPDGTDIHWSVTATDGQGFGGGTVDVSGGRFEGSTSLFLEPGSELLTEARFYPSDQAATAAMFGEHGERLRGEGVFDDSGSRGVRVQERVSVPE